MAKYILFTPIVFILSGCLSSFDLSEYQAPIKPEIRVEDVRQAIRPTTTQVNNLRHAVYVGENYLLPTPKEIVASKLSSKLPFIKSAQTYKLHQFDLIIWKPQHVSIATNAVMGSFSAFIDTLEEDLPANNFEEDGAIAVITLMNNGIEYSCFKYYPNFSAVNALLGIRADPAPMQQVFNSAIDDCLNQVVQKL